MESLRNGQACSAWANGFERGRMRGSKKRDCLLMLSSIDDPIILALPALNGASYGIAYLLEILDV